MNNGESTSQGDIKRRALFELFSQNLSYVKQHPNVRIRPDFDEGFICPICFKMFDRNSLSKEYDDYLTLEDVPPQALGGKVCTLTCKVCNNSAGTQLESHLKNKLRADLFLAGDSDIEMDARFRPNNAVDLAATVKLTSERGINIKYDPARSNPKELEKLGDLEEARSISSVNLRFHLGYNSRRSKIALLRAAYLKAFSMLGYGFLINGNLVKVRHQIQHPTEELLPSFGITRADFPDSTIGVSVIYEPVELQSFLVVFDLIIRDKKCRYGVLLPGPTEPGIGIYNRIAELQQREKRTPVEHKIHVIPEYDYLRDPNAAFASHDYWINLRDSQ